MTEPVWVNDEIGCRCPGMRPSRTGRPVLTAAPPRRRTTEHAGHGSTGLYCKSADCRREAAQIVWSAPATNRVEAGRIARPRRIA